MRILSHSKSSLQGWASEQRRKWRQKCEEKNKRSLEENLSTYLVGGWVPKLISDGGKTFNISLTPLTRFISNKRLIGIKGYFHVFLLNKFFLSLYFFWVSYFQTFLVVYTQLLQDASTSKLSRRHSMLSQSSVKRLFKWKQRCI